jgi:hypothetical protein
MPRVYLGLVRRDCLDRIHARTGHYFGGVSPDVYSALAIATCARSCVSVDYPLLIPGYSGGSNSGLSAMRRHIGRIEEAEHLKDYRPLDWPAEVPRFFSVETVWAQAAITAVRELNLNTCGRHLNLARLYAACLVKHPAFAGYTLSAIRNAAKQRPAGRLVTGIAAELARQGYRQTRRYLSGLMRYGRPAGEKQVMRSLETIENSSAALSSHLRSLSARFITAAGVAA